MIMHPITRELHWHMLDMTPPTTRIADLSGKFLRLWCALALMEAA